MSRAGECWFWAVSDGLGGHHGGRVAAQLAVEAARSAFADGPARATRETLGRCFEAANARVRAEQERDPSLRRMRATLVVLIADAQFAVWGHVGDTRLYRLEGGAVWHRTKDHSVSQALVDAGEVAREDQAEHEDRDRLLRVIGQSAEVEPTCADREPLRRGDAFLLCSDGFWEATPEAVLAVDLAATATAEEWLGRLEGRVNTRIREGSDNYSGIAIRVASGADLPPPRSPQAPVRRHEDAGADRGDASAALPAWRGGPMSLRALVVAVLLVAVGVAAGWYWRRIHLGQTPAAQGPAAPADPVGGPAAQSPASLAPQQVYLPRLQQHHASLAEALGAAQPGDEVWLGAGRFVAPGLRIDREVHLRGAGRDATTVDASGGRGVVVEAAAGSLIDLTVCCAVEGPVVQLEGTFAGIVSHVGLKGGAGDGLLVTGDASPTIEDVEIEAPNGERLRVEGRATPHLVRMPGY